MIVDVHKSSFIRMKIEVGRLVRTEQTSRCKVIKETEFYDTFYYYSACGVL